MFYELQSPHQLPCVSSLTLLLGISPSMKGACARFQEHQT